MGPEVFLAHDDKDIGKHDRRIDQGWDADPVLALDEGIDSGDIIGAEEQDIEPDGGFPPGWPRPLQRVEAAPPPVYHVDKEG